MSVLGNPFPNKERIEFKAIFLPRLNEATLKEIGFNVKAVHLILFLSHESMSTALEDSYQVCFMGFCFSRDSLEGISADGQIQMIFSRVW